MPQTFLSRFDPRTQRRGLKQPIAATLLGCLAVAAAGPSIPTARADEPAYIWIEAEKPDRAPKFVPDQRAPDDLGYRFTAWGDTSIVSGELLSINFSAEEAPKRIPAGGAVFGYDFQVAKPGRYEVWKRVGFEWIRAAFDWRIDQHDWQTATAEQPTEDVQLLQVWNELAWLKLGEVELGAGPHTIEIRHRPQTKRDPKTGQEQPERTLFYSDCMVFSRGRFRPNGRHKPDADYRTEDDRRAAAMVYKVGVSDMPAERSVTQLSGPWEIARWDENSVSPETRLAPPEALPDFGQLWWYGIAVPGDRNALRPDLAYSHRYIYRTRLDVPAEAAGRSVILEFQNFNMIAAVFVNGRRCGWSKAHSTEWSCDVTAAVRPGAINELAVVFKDAYYAIDEREHPLGCRRYWNLPHDWLHNQGVSMKFDMPVAWDTRTGILEPVSVIVAGAVYTSDVFAKPSVQRRELGLEITVANATGAPREVTVENHVVPWTRHREGEPRVEKRFATRKLTLAAGAAETIELVEPWADPRLWWPDDPQLYEVVTTLSVGGKPVDVRRTRFGFREWEWDGLVMKLNGVRWQLWADCDYPRTPQEWLEQSRRSGMNMIRYWRRDGWGGLTRREVLDLMDEHGVPVRNSGVFDGERAAYGLVEGRGDERRPRMALLDNWKEQLRAWVRAERNHPSVFVWSIENEIVFINLNNFGNGPLVEPEIRKAAEMVMAMDPTRPAMVDGGRALRDQSLPINGCHYNEESGCALRDYPDAAYTREHWYRTLHRGAWPMAPDRPIFHGECFYANGWTPARFAQLGGERCFIGVSETMAARGLMAKMLSEGWRWCDVAAWHFWFGEADRSYYSAWQPVCALVREWNSTFASGARVERTVKLFNGTRHADPIDLVWEVSVAGQRAAGATIRFDIPPGEARETKLAFTLPQVRRRQAGELLLACRRGDKEVFREVKPLSVIDPDAGPKPAIAPGRLAVIDPHGAARARLAARGVPMVECRSLADVPPSAEVILLGKDAVAASEAASPAWLALAAAGKRVVALEQAEPLRYQALPADLEVTDHVGRIAFAEDLSHPALAGLEQSDFFTWSGDHVVYRRCYEKATRGARSLVQCDAELGSTALVECPVGDGVILLCQLVVGEKLSGDPVAQRVFDNLIAYAAAYAPLRKATAAVVDPASEKGKLLARIGLEHTTLADPVAAIDGKYPIVVVDATPANLAKLAAALDRVRAFTDSGGWLMLWGVTPEGLADFNRIVGVEHVMRPFQRERVVLAMPRDPLSSGLTLRDVVMEDSERVASWMGLRWLADDEFTHVVDLTDIAPFCKMPSPEEMGKGPDRCAPGSDHWPPNMVNGLTAEDSWRYCYSILLDQGHKTRWTMELPREEELIDFAVVLNTIYHKVTKIHLYYDDDPNPVVLQTRPTSERQEFSLAGRRARRLTIELADWEKSGRQNVIGIDNFWIGVRRSPEFLQRVRPLTNIGGLVRYNLGKGGVVLNQLNILAQERLPLNAEKKATIVKTLLKNLGATFGGGRLVIVGANLRYEPIPIPEAKCNAYFRKGNDGWFRHPTGDLSHLPLGENTFAGVKYAIPDLKTSPVPSCIILRDRAKEEGVRDLPVGRKADALFFLHTLGASRQALTWQPGRRAQDTTPPVVFQYVVHYADGQSADVPVRLGQGVGHWLAAEPKALREAAVAWSADLPGEATEKAVLYSMQWNNPRPEVEIRSIDIVCPEDARRYGEPAVLAITAARAAP